MELLLVYEQDYHFGRFQAVYKDSQLTASNH